jgi:hypothetical protein
MSSNKGTCGYEPSAPEPSRPWINWLIRIVVGLVDSQNDVTNLPKRVFLDASSKSP